MSERTKARPEDPHPLRQTGILSQQETRQKMAEQCSTRTRTRTATLLLFLFAFLQRPPTIHASAFIQTGWTPVKTTSVVSTSRSPTWITMSSTKSAAETKAGASQSTDSSTLTLFSPCKVNLFLRILRKRKDGYHDLASLFQAVGFGDTLELTPIQGEKDEFTCNMPGVPVDSSNLVLRALELMRQKTGCTDQFFRANLIKKCPAQAGLGGGSANAATAMWGANQLMGEPATVEQVYMLLLL
jgi:hypothetical protein